MSKEINFTSFIVKVASRCNLNCDYCYMYQHVDQTWKDKPRTLSKEHQDLFTYRLEEYVKEKNLEKILIIYHGGEPILFGVDKMIQLSENIRERLNFLGCKVDFGMQTNGVLLKKEHLEKFEKYRISVSLSIDGPKEIHDSHRIDLRGKPTFDRVFKAMKLLQEHPSIFTGCIAVINPYFNPKDFFDFFDRNGISELNILLPDANYITPPVGRNKDPDLYRNWLINAFDYWFDNCPHIKCKYFDSLLQGIFGQRMITDSYGLGDINLLVLETDGTYHDHDVLKITEENSSSLGLSLENHPIKDAEKAPKIEFHRKLLTKEGLSKQCQSCKHIEMCGGGFIGHRFSNEGYANPSIYCGELYDLFDHVIARVSKQITIESQNQGIQFLEEFNESKMDTFFDSKTSRKTVELLQEYFARKNFSKLHSVIPYAIEYFPECSESIIACQNVSFEILKPALLHPTTNSWLRAIYCKSKGKCAYNHTGNELPADASYFNELIELSSIPKTDSFIIQAPGKWFRISLGDNIILKHSKAELEKGLPVLRDALEIIKNYQRELYEEMTIISPHIQIVKDTNADPDKDISFSDETLPGVIFIGLWRSTENLSPYMVAASLIHEHLHQKLYLLQNRFELFLPQDTLIYSPWPKKWRSPSLAVHAAYVFTHIGHFWKEMVDKKCELEISTKELEALIEKLDPMVRDIKEKVFFTKTGELFFKCLLNKHRELQEKLSLSYA